MNTIIYADHCVYDLNYHLVLVTKFRRNCLYGPFEADLKQECIRLITNMGGVVHEIETDRNHIHMLISLKPSVLIGKAVMVLKSTTCRNLKKRHPEHFYNFYWRPGISMWNDGYYAATAGGVTIDVLKQYVEAQKSPEHHKK